jgi:hypothetical protein
MIGRQRKKERKTHRRSRVSVNFSGKGGSGSNSSGAPVTSRDGEVVDGVQLVKAHSQAWSASWIAP